MGTDYLIRPYEDADKTAFQKLFGHYFTKDFSKSIYLVRLAEVEANIGIFCGGAESNLWP